MKKITLLAILCFNLHLIAQSKDFILLDSISKKPIDLVQISYPNLEIGSVSNKDGKVRIPLKKENIYISHINYLEKKISYNNFKSRDTLYLLPKTNQLDEIVISNLDLMKKFINILENTYKKEYSRKKVVHKTTYKETFSVNDSLARLFQVQLNWWSKNSLFKRNKAIDKQNKIYLESVDYSKIKRVNKDFISSNGAYVENGVFFQFAHLNFLLEILKDLAYDFEINSLEKNGNSISVYFDAVLRQKGKLIYHHKNSLIVFDKDYKHIKHLKFNMVYSSDFEDKISKLHNIPYQSKTKKHVIELAFKPLKNNKLSISYFVSELFATLKTKGYTDEIVSKQSLFIAESNLGKKLKKGNINFYEPFYKNVKDDLKNNDVKILLTQKEKQFLESKN
ncbi:MAG: hypothetical protein AB8B78_01475 [Polaribacter sp.]